MKLQGFILIYVSVNSTTHHLHINYKNINKSHHKKVVSGIDLERNVTSSGRYTQAGDPWDPHQSKILYLSMEFQGDLIWFQVMIEGGRCKGTNTNPGQVLGSF